MAVWKDVQPRFKAVLAMFGEMAETCSPAWVPCWCGVQRCFAWANVATGEVAIYEEDVVDDDASFGDCAGAGADSDVAHEGVAFAAVCLPMLCLEDVFVSKAVVPADVSDPALLSFGEKRALF